MPEAKAVADHSSGHDYPALLRSDRQLSRMHFGRLSDKQYGAVIHRPLVRAADGANAHENCARPVADKC
jgi:hypothetical protein